MEKQRQKHNNVSSTHMWRARNTLFIVDSIIIIIVIFIKRVCNIEMRLFTYAQQ